MKQQTENNPIVKQWLDEHKGYRVPVRSEGDYERFATSKASCCWGQPTTMPKGVKISVCTPSIQSKGDVAVLFYDYVIE